MRLTVHTDYSLRLLMCLALEPGRRMTIAEVAARYRISRHHLMKVAMNLANAGFVEASRGRHGGLRLARPPAAIMLGEVVRAVEEDLALAECFDRTGNTCVVSRACSLKGVLQEALAAFLGVLDRSTLADLVAPAGAASLGRLLGGIPVVVVPAPARGVRRPAHATRRS